MYRDWQYLAPLGVVLLNMQICLSAKMLQSDFFFLISTLPTRPERFQNPVHGTSTAALQYGLVQILTTLGKLKRASQGR